MSLPQLVLFTDLDGTFIDFDTYACDLTAPLARALAARGIPVVFCSSKTFAEQRALQESIGLRVPCILENGAGIAVPVDAWPHWPEGGSVSQGWGRWALGSDAEEIARGVGRVAREIGESFHDFRSLSTSEVARLTGLDLAAAERARQREFSVTLTDAHPEAFWDRLAPHFEKEGLRCLPGGRFHTVFDATTNKGVALKRFVALWREAAGDDFACRTVALGDSPNDCDMLAAADLAYQVQRPDGSFEEIPVAGVRKVEAIGPEGWVSAVTGLMLEYGVDLSSEMPH